MSPLAPLNVADLKDVLIRAPWWAMTNRPSLIGNNSTRQKKSMIPHPPRDNPDN